MPTISLGERLVWLRTFKRGGHVLGTEGHSTDLVPLAPIFAGAQ